MNPYLSFVTFVGAILTRVPEVNDEKPFPVATLCTTNYTWAGLELILGLREKRPGTDSRRFGAAQACVMTRLSDRSKKVKFSHNRPLQAQRVLRS